MAIGTKKVFRQNTLGTDVLGVDPANGTVEICVLGGTQASLEDKEAFLKELASCFREAYNWTAAQLGVREDSKIEQSESEDINLESWPETIERAVKEVFRNYRKERL